ncbi:A/G-specific DNA glycosylase [Methanonatronarchaeum thermophilum]|uniref:A/G-specific DNA glycosylase n=1 Tax=Methanonatronarchaeum thermophilum TaxID=1927129 RepID=A0A1Y3GBD3_9EURY|nr:hypothetical protein [Methanonatronarchaeum thermophilum]OUJ18772.1 A/G-specific DNA glycosylase [Methanonatronarchaeum thermophilum]
MTKKPNLPFGQTKTTQKEIIKNTKPKKAIKILENQKIPNSKQKIYGLLNKLPDLLQWLQKNGRKYPWRNTTNPWKVYIAEILLQRTKADQVKKIYPDFIKKYPEPHTLHKAKPDEIKKQIERLGLKNHRTRTLKSTAKIITEKHNGKVPENIKDLKKPWRIGEYTARAVQIFAHQKPKSLIDTNTARITKRTLNYPLPEQPHKNKKLYQLTDALTPQKPGLSRATNLANIDLAAKICKPINPECKKCPLKETCTHNKNKSTIN